MTSFFQPFFSHPGDRVMKSNVSPSRLAGIFVLSGMLTGVLAIVLSLMAVLIERNYSAAGVLLLAASVSFGLLANAIYRK